MPVPTQDPFSRGGKTVFRRRQVKKRPSRTIPQIAKRKLLPWVTLVLGFLLGVGVIVSILEGIYQPDGFTITTIDVPKTLLERGLSSTAVSERLSDNIQKIVADASQQLQGPPREPPDITIPTTGMSTQKLVAWINSYLPESWHHSINGEIISNDSSGQSFTVAFRMNGRALRKQTIYANDINTGLDHAMRQISMDIMEKIDLYLVTTALIVDSKYYEAEDRVDEILSTYPPDSRKIQAAWNLKGYLAEKRGDIVAAKKYYRIANTSTSMDNLAGIELNECMKDSEKCDIDEIQSIYQKAVDLKPESAYAHYALGNYLYQIGFEMCDSAKRDSVYLQSENELSKAIHLDGTDANAYAGMGLINYFKYDSSGRSVSLGYLAAAVRRNATDDNRKSQLTLLRIIEQDPRVKLFAARNPEDNMIRNVAARDSACATSESGAGAVASARGQSAALHVP
ncbi:hypothetical protein PQR67_27125 [Paraburkholderia fungorum]|uniref:tetratricopeptide repeat protein n=1 Tax=Paraburkholderia fungorum TaxID=134537 RepID=UPI0038B8D210